MAKTVAKKVSKDDGAEEVAPTLKRQTRASGKAAEEPKKKRAKKVVEEPSQGDSDFMDDVEEDAEDDEEIDLEESSDGEEDDVDEEEEEEGEDDEVDEDEESEEEEMPEPEKTKKKVAKVMKKFGKKVSKEEEKKMINVPKKKDLGRKTFLIVRKAEAGAVVPSIPSSTKVRVSRNIVEKVKADGSVEAFIYKTGCGLIKLANMIDGLTFEQKKCVKQIGFGGLLELKLKQVPTSLVAFLLTRFDANCMLQKIGDDKYHLLPEDVYDTFKLPFCRGNNVISVSQRGHGDVNDEAVRRRWLNTYENCVVGTKVSNLSTVLLMKRMESLVDGGEEFIRLFVIVVCSIFLTPTANHHADMCLVSQLEDTSQLGSLDWCTYVYEHFSKACSRYMGNSLNPQKLNACDILLVVAYLVRYPHRGVPVPRDLPLIQHFDDASLKIRLKDEETKGYGSQICRASSFPITEVSNEQLPGLGFVSKKPSSSNRGTDDTVPVTSSCPGRLEAVSNLRACVANALVEYKNTVTMNTETKIIPTPAEDTDPDAMKFADKMIWLHRDAIEAPSFSLGFSQLSQEVKEEDEEIDWDIWVEKFDTDAMLKKQLEERAMNVAKNNNVEVDVVKIGKEAVGTVSEDEEDGEDSSIPDLSKNEQPGTSALMDKDKPVSVDNSQDFDEGAAVENNDPVDKNYSLGCTLEVIEAGNPEELLYLSPFLKAQKANLTGMGLLKRNLADYVFYTANNPRKPDDDEFAWYNEHFYLRREQIKALGGDGPVYADMIDAYSLILNDVEYKRNGGNMHSFRFSLDASHYWGRLAGLFDDDVNSFPGHDENDARTYMINNFKSWIESNSKDRTLNLVDLRLVYVPFLRKFDKEREDQNHFVCFVLDMDRKKVHYLDNRTYDAVIAQRLFSHLRIAMSMFLKWLKHPCADEVLQYEFSYVNLDWNNLNDNYDCGIFVIKHMELFKGEKFSEPNMKRKNVRKKLRVEICSTLLLADINTKREGLLEKVHDYVETMRPYIYQCMLTEQKEKRKKELQAAQAAQAEKGAKKTGKKKVEKEGQKKEKDGVDPPVRKLQLRK